MTTTIAARRPKPAKGIKTKLASQVYKENRDRLESLMRDLKTYTKEAGKCVHTLLEIDREAGMRDMISLGLSNSTILGLERVGLENLHPDVFLNGKQAATMAYSLSYADQTLLVEVGVPVLTGGTREAPVYEVQKLSSLNDRSARLLIDIKNRCLRSKKAMAELRFKVRKTNTARYSVSEGVLTFHSRRWLVSEIISLAATLAAEKK
jgi:hypothetical protein